jgi:diguanylate cyclase (GGDEF)-like protein
MSAIFSPSPLASASDVDRRAQVSHQASMSRIQDLLENGFPLMSFPAELEQAFQQDALPARERHFLISGLISLLIYNGYLLADLLMTPDVIWLAAQLRLLVFTPIALLSLFLFWRGVHPFRRLFRHSLVDVLSLLGGVGAAISLVVVMPLSESPMVFFYPVGHMVVITYGNVVQRLRFWYALAFTFIMLGLFVGGVMALPNFPPRLLWPICSMVVSVAIFTLCANYFMERDERRRFLRTLRERSLVRDLTQAHARLKDISRIDPLTGLHNQRHIQQHLNLVWERAWRDRSHLSLLLIDIDHFKKFNDRYGHTSGDECLQKVGRVLQDGLRRPGDVVARLGGEEFLVVLPHTDASFANGVAERLRQAVESLQIRHESSTTARHLTVSVGMVACQAHPDLTVGSLMQRVEHALQQAKREGRNRVCGDQP